MRKLLVMLGVLAFVSNEGAPRVYSAENAAPAGQPANGAKVARAKKIVATGTVEPEQVFSVHSQVTGAIIAFGTDAAGKPIDYGFGRGSGHRLGADRQQNLCGPCRTRAGWLPDGRSRTGQGKAQPGTR